MMFKSHEKILQKTISETHHTENLARFFRIACLRNFSSIFVNTIFVFFRTRTRRSRRTRRPKPTKPLDYEDLDDFTTSKVIEDTTNLEILEGNEVISDKGEEFLQAQTSKTIESTLPTTPPDNFLTTVEYDF